MTGPSPRKNEGLTLIEAAIAASVLGVFLAVFVPTFIREIRTSKISEATDQLSVMHRNTAAYFDRPHVIDGLGRRWCLPDAAGPTPAQPWYDPVETDFGATDVAGHLTWTALGFQPGPIRYRYTFLPETTGCGIRRPPHTPVVTYRAEGDLDEDGVLSTFERTDAVTDEGALVPEGALHIRNRVD
ncbi:MAG: hypothetical protein U0230_07660 [Polyangiales bacterium]